MNIILILLGVLLIVTILWIYHLKESIQCLKTDLKQANKWKSRAEMWLSNKRIEFVLICIERDIQAYEETVPLDIKDIDYQLVQLKQLQKFRDDVKFQQDNMNFW